jgi:hypothetical protein
VAEYSQKLWTPDTRSFGASVVEIVKAYSLFLEVRHPEHYRAFQLRSTNDPNAANAEAVVFSWLRLHGLSPTLNDTPGRAGPDFLCSPLSDAPFLIEVTHLKPDDVSKRSGWPDELNDRAQSFAMITPNLWYKTKNKAAQLGGHEIARVHAICLTHIGADVLLGTLAAQWLMTSQPKLSVPIGVPITTIGEITDLSKSAFLSIRDDAIVAERKSISAILLIAIFENELHAVGMLHPEPAVAFNYRTFIELPFLRIDWPVKDGNLITEWVMAKPTPRVDRHIPMSLNYEELRGG